MNRRCAGWGGHWLGVGTGWEWALLRGLLAASWLRTRGSLCTFTLPPCPSPRAGLDPHPHPHQARAAWKEPHTLGSGQCIWIQGGMGMGWRPEGLHRDSGPLCVRASHIIFRERQGSPALAAQTHVGARPPLLSLSSWPWPTLPLGSRRIRERGSVQAQLAPSCASSIGSMSHQFIKA